MRITPHKDTSFKRSVFAFIGVANNITPAFEQGTAGCFTSEFLFYSLRDTQNHKVEFSNRINRRWWIVYQFLLKHNILKPPLAQTILIQITKVNFVVKINFFMPGVAVSGRFEHSSPVCLWSEWLKLPGKLFLWPAMPKKWGIEVWAQLNGRAGS